MDISDFLRFERASQDGSPGALFWLAARFRRGRIWVMPADAAPVVREWLAFSASDQIGDAPDKIHPLFLAATLLSAPPRPVAGIEDIAQVTVPRIAFSTPEEVRRSMTLNAMRMTTEYRQNGSPRVLQLVENRLALGQSDIVHDLMVYIVRQIFDVRAADREERNLRADSVAAYLGLEEMKVRPLFQSVRLNARAIAARLSDGAAGTIRRALDVPALITSQIELLQPELRELRAQETHYLALLDGVAAHLSKAKSTPENRRTFVD